MSWYSVRWKNTNLSMLRIMGTFFEIVVSQFEQDYFNSIETIEILDKMEFCYFFSKHFYVKLNNHLIFSVSDGLMWEKFTRFQELLKKNIMIPSWKLSCEIVFTWYKSVLNAFFVKTTKVHLIYFETWAGVVWPGLDQAA